MLRESGSLMVGQYFKRRRVAVEAALASADGVGLAAVASATDALLK